MFAFLRRLLKAEDVNLLAAEATPESETEVALIRACRSLFGSTPRSLVAEDIQALRLNLAPELETAFRESNDPMLRILADQPALRDRGEIVWGRLVQANQILFDPSNGYTAPANVIYSPDHYFDGRADLLGRVAHGLFAQKGTVPKDRAVREFVRAITNERERIMRRELPRTYCGGRSIYFTTCFIQPGHLPGNCIARQKFSLLVNFRETEAVMILPSLFWPAGLVSQWLN